MRLGLGARAVEFGPNFRDLNVARDVHPRSDVSARSIRRWTSSFSVFLCAASLGLGGAGCAPDEGLDELEELEDTALGEEELNEPGFDRHRLLGDVAFVDASALTVDEIQAFLENTPYGGRSALASYSSGGRSAARAIHEAAQAHGINPLLILTRAQLEMSLIGKATASQFSLDYAFGCGCPDNQSCSTQWKGFHRQVDCMASHMRDYVDDLEAGGSTIAGWKIGKSKKTLDGYTITPKNAATAALYTYTPHVGAAGSGNLGHFKIWKKFAAYVGYLPEGPGGCRAQVYPSGAAIQLYPSAPLTEAYGMSLGLVAEAAPSCFLDVGRLEDPVSGVLAPKSVKLSSNFALSEFLAGEPSSSRMLLVDPALVDRMQVFRGKLGTAVSIVDGFRSPERHLDRCDGACQSSSCLDSCEATLPLALGSGAIVTSSASAQKMLDAASRSGFSTCWLDGTSLYVDVATPGLGCPAQ